MAANPNKRFRCPRHWTLAQRLDHYTDKSGGPDACWPWVGSHDGKRYGMLNWKGQPRRVSRLTWELSNGPIPVGMQVCHRCDNPPCRNEAHLWLGAGSANMADMAAKGRSPRGEAHCHAKLTDDQARAIRAAGGTLSAIAARFGVGQVTVSNIKNRKSWKHL